MALTETLKVVVDFETKQAEQAAGGLKKGIGGLTGALAGGALVGVAAAAGTAVLGFAKDSVMAASDVQQSTGAVEAVFKDMAGEVKKDAGRAADSVGLSVGQYQELAAVTGALLKGKGITSMGELADATETLTLRGADLASMFGGTTAEAVDAMGSALKGQFDPLEKYGISLSAAKVEAEAVAMGQVDAAGKATEYGKAMAAQALIMEQSTDSAGNFAKESDTLAGSQQKLKAQFDNVKTGIGTALLPIVQAFANFLSNTLMPGVTKLIELFKQHWPTIWAVVKPVFSAIQEIAKLVIGNLIRFWDEYGDEIKRFVIPILEYLGETFSNIGGVIKGVMDVIMGILTGDWDRAWSGAKRIFESFVNQIRGLLNLLIRGWNALDFKLDFKLPDILGGAQIKTGDLIPDIPLLASGGIARRPTLAIVGEAGPEAIVPLGSSALGSNTYQITVNAGVGDPAEIGAQVVAAIRVYERMAGPSWREAS